MTKTTDRPGRRVTLVISKIVAYGVMLLILVCSGLTVLMPFAQVGWILATGWLTFLFRTSREMSINVSSLAWFAVCLLLLLFLTHRTSIWLLVRPTAAASTGQPIREWPFRNSCVLLLAVLCSFIAGVCLVGITHETVWMATSKEPLIEKGGRFRRTMLRIQSTNNLKQLGIAFHGHHDARQGFPASTSFDERGGIRHGWVAPLLPFLDAITLYNRVRFDLPWSAVENRPVFERSLNKLTNSGVSEPHLDEHGYALIDYAGNSLVLQPGRERPIGEITDGTSSTILIGEVNSNFQPWGKPGNCRDPRLGLNKSPRGFGSPFAGAVQFLMVDGTVRNVSENIDPQVLKAISTPHDGELVGDF